MRDMTPSEDDKTLPKLPAISKHLHTNPKGIKCIISYSLQTRLTWKYTTVLGTFGLILMKMLQMKSGEIKIKSVSTLLHGFIWATLISNLQNLP